MQLRTCLECVESLLGWRKGVCRKKIETHRKIVGGSQKACRELERTSLKVPGRLLGTRREAPEENRDTHRRECRRLLDYGRVVDLCPSKKIISEHQWASTKDPGVDVGMGGFSRGPRQVNRRKYPESRVWAVQPPSLGGLAADSRPKSWVAVVHPSLTDG
ncbi:hypothetical protein BHM03_00062100 [Ensete ventricosum]|nr:hypothetical protein BHM03_00062100 [Ensete ventricosum]